jgi:N,N'-diacetyllegionaminate synthase
MTKTIIIAEAGVNHNGDINLAKQLIEVASQAGADFVKFQTFKAENQTTSSAKKADYQLKNTVNTETQKEMLRRLELTEDMHYQLIDYCKKCNIRFLSTGFDIESVNFLKKIGQEYFKIPSGEINNLPYLNHIGRLGGKIILSTGMSTLGDIEAAIDVLEIAGTLRSDIIVLHCTTEYPTPMVEVNLRAMQTIRGAFGVSVGYSDHTLGIEVPIAAVAIGACIVEKHFTLSRDLPGPDHKASLEPKELTNMVLSIRNIELALGDGVKRLTNSEHKNQYLIRKSLVASQKIRVGEKFTIKNVTVKRPGTGISPMKFYEVIGKNAKRNFLIDDLIEL